MDYHAQTPISWGLDHNDKCRSPRADGKSFSGCSGKTRQAFVGETTKFSATLIDHISKLGEFTREGVHGVVCRTPAPSGEARATALSRCFVRFSALLDGCSFVQDG